MTNKTSNKASASKTSGTAAAVSENSNGTTTTKNNKNTPLPVENKQPTPPATTSSSSTAPSSPSSSSKKTTSSPIVTVKVKASINPFSWTLSNTREHFFRLSLYNKSQALAPWYGIASAIYGFDVQPRRLGSELAGSICTINVLTLYTSVMSLFIFDLTVNCRKLSTTHEFYLFLHNMVIHSFAFITLSIILNNKEGSGEATDVLSLLFHVFMTIVASARLSKVLIIRSFKRVGQFCERIFGLNMSEEEIDQHVVIEKSNKQHSQPTSSKDNNYTDPKKNKNGSHSTDKSVVANIEITINAV